MWTPLAMQASGLECLAITSTFEESVLHTRPLRRCGHDCRDFEQLAGA
ncbi:hypothetical protein SAMN04487926_105284 [Paraburkholderia steynii]|uniref:Uncharacterized protein n=1 Tax=Paraburkholderia steynii TaxID=1245441 RepID=A0A7Z7B4H1_9BURK|nr:hypothetical protein SAMN04487926_105284 [Paraburkholderia steynii]